MKDFIEKLFTWYFDRKSLPYWALIILDCLIVYLSGLYSYWLYSRGVETLANVVPITHTLLLYLGLYIISFRVFHTYSGIIRYSSFSDLKRIVYAMALGTLLAFILHRWMFTWETTQFFKLGGNHVAVMGMTATVLMCAVRVLVKTIYDSVFLNSSAVPALVYGVKDGGVMIANTIRNERPTRFLLKGFISHENQFAHQRLIGEKVFAADDELKKHIEKNGIKAILVSPLRNDDFRNDQKLQELLLEAGVQIYMAKGLDLGTDNIKNSQQLQEVSIEDLLPRDEISIDMHAIEEQLRGKTIMITGSAGSIGFEIVKQVASYKPRLLVLIDQAETPQHDVRLYMKKQWPDIKTETIVTSICKEKRMEQIFSEYRPDYVFHAAAYKHVPMMEDNPAESVQNNILGTKIIADLAVRYGVKKFVMVSTDKAVNPTNVMGCSKRICEIYVQSLDKAIKDGKFDGAFTQFVTTRFGNVLDSNGSVIPLFRKQIASGGPITVTHPDIIRYFMLIPEACALVLEAGTSGRGGEVFAFDMGKPVKIADLAKRMIQLSDAKNIEIVYTGLRPGEKLYEEVLNDEELTIATTNPKIRIARLKVYEYEEICKEINKLIETTLHYDDMKIVAMMKRIVPEYKSQNSVYEQLDSQLKKSND